MKTIRSSRDPVARRSGGDRVPPARGFTLIEILVALAVIAVALAAIVGETVQHLGNAAHLRDRTLAHWVAMNEITELQLSTEWPAVGATNGSVQMGGREWFWTANVSGTEDADVHRVDVEVRAEREQDKPDATAIAYLGRPT